MASWRDAAACDGMDLELFFGPDGERQPERDVREYKAKGVCTACPVRGECLSFALGNGEKAGVWGGMTPEERARRLRQIKRRQAARTAEVAS